MGPGRVRGGVKVCMRPTINRISTIDGDDPVNYTPRDPDRFAIGLRLLVGAVVKRSGCNLFEVLLSRADEQV
jgi:hypothetical protein